MREGLRENRQALVCLGVKVRNGDLESGSFLVLSPDASLEGQADMAATRWLFLRAMVALVAQDAFMNVGWGRVGRAC